MWTRSELKTKAKAAFKANYWPSVLAALVLSIFTAAGGNSGRNATQNASSNGGDYNSTLVVAVVLAILLALVVVTIVKIIVGNALIVGSQKLFINNEIAKDDAKVATIGYIFKNGYWKNVAITMFLKDLFIFLWTLLLVIPGIIKSYEYRMIPYLLAENPDMDYKEAFAKSKEMMNGQKWNAFVLDLSFIGWGILSLLTLGILSVFYVAPYVCQTSAELYLTLKKDA